MRSIFSLLIFCLICSCSHNKVVQLPEITSSDINTVLDVSPAYIFYDETQQDSVDLNRKNLIGTTNWLFNVDKRLTLKQVVPHIVFLQEKKRNAQMHKNENAKNYYTCNNTSIKDLGFIEFTNVEYHLNISDTLSSLPHIKNSNTPIIVNFKNNNTISLINNQSKLITTTLDTLIDTIKEIDMAGNTIYLNFNKSLLFQDYITYKSMLIKVDLKQAKISNQEFIHN